MVSFVLAAVLLTPPPRHLQWIAESFALPEPLTVSAATDDERQVARVLAGEFRRLHHVGVSVTAAGMGGAIQLALAATPRGQALLSRLPGAALYAEKKGPETYLLEAGASGVTIVAETPRALLFGVQTLLQLVRKGATGSQVAGVRVVDYPELGFRGLHICIFPNTELAAVRQAMLVAARYKYNAVVIEPWASLQSARRPETAYQHAYTPAQLKPLIELGRALHLEMIPMLNSWGHASGMRSRSGLHVVLDRFPQFRPLYEEDGWSFCLTNPAIYDQLFDRYAELLELFGHPRRFHLGLDEAWGHRGLMSSPRCRGDNPRATLAAHLKRLYEYFAARRVQVFLWHDMFLQRDHPQLGRLSPANSVPPFDSHLVLDELPKDVVIAAWNYEETREWPVPKYFHDRGFPVVVCPWKSRHNAVALLNVAKKHHLMGLLQTTWDSLDVALPTVAEAGMMAWAGPDFQLGSVPFDDILGALRTLPICDLPRYETTLERGDK
jgi:hexosaminidase